MTRRFEGGRLIVASHNRGKVTEIRDLLSGYTDDVVSAGDLGLPEPAETAPDFLGNAALKATAAATAAGHPALADDSGLCVDALGGEPGIYTARWAETPTGRDFAVAMQKVEDALLAKGVTDPKDRGAHFVCALALAWPDGHVAAVEGRATGTLVWPMRGTNGFGFDPVFAPEGHDITFGEMDPAFKHAISHRADAFRQLVAKVFA